MVTPPPKGPAAPVDVAATILRRCTTMWKRHDDEAWHTCRWMHHFVNDLPHECAWCGDVADGPTFCHGPGERL